MMQEDIDTVVLWANTWQRNSLFHDVLHIILQATKYKVETQYTHPCYLALNVNI